jgi:hypothetical protein
MPRLSPDASISEEYQILGGNVISPAEYLESLMTGTVAVLE